MPAAPGCGECIRVCLLKPSVAMKWALLPTPLDISKAADREVTAKNIAKREKTGKGLSKYGLQPVLRAYVSSRLHLLQFRV